MIPSFRIAQCDRRLGARAFRVYAFCVTELDVREFRPLKQDFIHRRLGIQQPHVGADLRQLADLGYLEVGARDGLTHTYRLVYHVAREAGVA